jgi:hypothetical protein
MFGLSQPHAHIVSKFIIDGTTYDVEKFDIKFNQPVDFKGQPQHETKGGQIYLTLAQTADDALLLWAKKSTLQKSGQVVFQTDMGISVLRVNFTDGYCITLGRSFNALMGTNTSIVISSSVISMNGIEHDNRW